MATMQAAFAAGSVKNLMSQWEKFSSYKETYGQVHLPISQKDLCRYVQYLSDQLRSPQSVLNYVSGLKTLHVLLDLSTTSFSSWELKLMLKGVKRLKQHKVRQAAPMTFDLLKRMSSFVDAANPLHRSCWAAILVSFYCMLRSSNAVPKAKKSFSSEKQLVVADFRLDQHVAVVSLKWSKTIQFAQREVLLPMLANPDPALDPIRALRAVWSPFGTPDPNQQAFAVFRARKTPTVLTYAKLSHQFRKWVSSAGSDPHSFSLHSLRRGAATMAFAAKVPGEVIQSHGDWASDAYLKYISVSLNHRIMVAHALRQSSISGVLHLPPAQ